MVARTGSILDPNHALPACLHARIMDSPRSARSSGTYNLTNHYDGDARSLIEPTVFKEPREANELSEGCGDTAQPELLAHVSRVNTHVGHGAVVSHTTQTAQSLTAATEISATSPVLFGNDARDGGRWPFPNPKF